MSADNWTTCPKCRVAFLKKIDDAKRKAESAYGKVSEAAYHAILKAAKEEEGKQQEETLREDYGIGMGEDFDFYVSYSCFCKTCGFKFQFKYEEKAKP